MQGARRPDARIEDAVPAQCQAVVLSCIDFRFVEPMRRFLAGRGLSGAVDLIAWPGGAAALATPDRDAIIDTIRMACELHCPAEIVLVAHHDCGQLGGSACFAGPCPRAADERHRCLAAGSRSHRATDRLLLAALLGPARGDLPPVAGAQRPR